MMINNNVRNYELVFSDKHLFIKRKTHTEMFYDCVIFSNLHFNVNLNISCRTTDLCLPVGQT